MERIRNEYGGFFAVGEARRVRPPPRRHGKIFMDGHQGIEIPKRTSLADQTAAGILKAL